LAILLSAFVAFHALFGGANGMVVLCLGGGHQHAPEASDQCESTCSHARSWPLRLPAEAHDCDCGCTDVEFTIAELLRLPRGDDAGHVLPAIVCSPAWGVVVVEAGIGRRGPPAPPRWFDPGGVHRLAVVASVRLTT
jgi:hypothetical protein